MNTPKQLTIEHLAAYLPYGVRVINKYGSKMMFGGVDHDFSSGVIHLLNSEYPDYQMTSLTDKLILRPLSDLTKEITHNGKVFVPMEVLKSEHPHAFNFYGKLDSGDPNDLPYSLMKRMLEWHFDTFGLLDANFAIDINTINQ